MFVSYVFRGLFKDGDPVKPSLNTEGPEAFSAESSKAECATDVAIEAEVNIELPDGPAYVVQKKTLMTTRNTLKEIQNNRKPWSGSINVFGSESKSLTLLAQHRKWACEHDRVTDVGDLIALSQAKLDPEAVSKLLELHTELPVSDALHVKAMWDVANNSSDEVIMKSFSFGKLRLHWNARQLRRLSTAPTKDASKWLCDETVNLYMLLLGLKYVDCLFLKSLIFPLLSSSGKDSFRKGKVKFAKMFVKFFEYKRVFFPVHKATHWFLIVVYVEEKRIQCYDSMGLLRTEELTSVLIFLKGMFPKSDWDGWMLQEVQILNALGALETPQQTNGYDCGPLMCMTAEFTAYGLPLVFSQACAQNYRKKMTLALLSHNDGRRRSTPRMCITPAELKVGGDAGRGSSLQRRTR
jgi:hypothetical protein